MRVGVNYPWFDYGWDFGIAPPTWRESGANPRWDSEIENHIEFLRSLGITVVRWFILGDGLTYGTGAGAPQLEQSPRPAWRFEPGPLSSEFLQHFHKLLSRFANSNKDQRRLVQLLPVFIDFSFCCPGEFATTRPDPSAPPTKMPDPDWVKKGRADALTDARKRGKLLDEALDKLLAVSKEFKTAIYAWELISEPEFVTTNWHPTDRQTNHPVDEDSMRAFLEEGKERVRRAGFKPTIGFNLIETLRRSQITCEINQFHHYPAGWKKLAKHEFDQKYPAIIGEFATSTADTWPELVGAGQSLLNRLRLANRLGYPLAIPWSFRQHDSHSCWTVDSARDIECFTQNRNCFRSPSGELTDPPDRFVMSPE